jgi:hypothetical protein
MMCTELGSSNTELQPQKRILKNPTLHTDGYEILFKFSNNCRFFAQCMKSTLSVEIVATAP